MTHMMEWLVLQGGDLAAKTCIHSNEPIFATSGSIHVSAS